MKYVTLSGNLSMATVHRCINQFLDAQKRPIDAQFRINFSDLSFITPVGATALANLFMYMIKCGCQLAVDWPPSPPSDAIKHLDGCGFFEIFFQRKYDEHSKCRKSTVPLKILAYKEYMAWMGQEVLPWLSNCLCFDIRRHWPSFSVVLGEIFNNVKDHAGVDADVASTMMQHYYNKNEVEIAIADFGVGIPARVREVIPNIDDDMAILQSVQDRFSTRTKPENRGAGLDTIIKNTVDYNQGVVRIISGYGSVTFTTAHRIGKPLKHAVPYPGVLIQLTLRTDTINQAESYEEDLSW